MRKVASLFFLLLMTVNLAGFYGYFIVRLQEIHAEARAALRLLPESRLQRFEFSKDEFRRMTVEDSEVRVNGRMYDIARTVNSGSSVVVWAMHDEAEDDLFAFINTVTNNAAGDDQQAPSALTSFLTLQFISPVTLALVSAPVSRDAHRTSWIEVQPRSASNDTWMPPERI